MDLAARVAEEWQRKNAGAIAAIESNMAMQKDFLAKSRDVKKLLNYCRCMMDFWVPILEKDPPQPERVAREMKGFIKEIRELLNAEL
jgi:hypothetical protein